MSENSNDKWSMFKQFLHNEMGISKKDIVEWIREAVKEEARKLIRQTYGSYSTEAIVNKVLMDIVDKDISKRAYSRDVIHGKTAKLLADRLEIKVKGD